MQRIDHQQCELLLRENPQVVVINTASQGRVPQLSHRRPIHIPQKDPRFVQHVEAMVGNNKDIPVLVTGHDEGEPDSLDAGTKLDQCGFTRVFELAD